MGNKTLKEKGISIKGLEGLTIGDIKKLDKEFRKKNLKVENIKLVKSYGRKIKL